MRLLAGPDYMSDRTGSQLYVSRFGDPVLDVAMGFRSENNAMSAISSVMWLCCSKPVLLIPLFQALTATGLDEHEPVARFIPEFAGAGKDGVTLAHVLTHTVPYRSLGISWAPEREIGNEAQADDEAQVLAASWDAALKLICAMPLVASPGERVTYTAASNWMLLAEVLERLTGRPHEESVRALVLEPLDMDQTSVYLTEQSLPTVERAPLWTLNEAGDPQSAEMDNEPWLCSRWPGLACRGPARDMAKPIECAAGWRNPECVNATWRAKMPLAVVR